MSPGRPRWLGVLGGVSLALVLAVPACTSTRSAGPPERASVTVRPGLSVADQAVHIAVTGLRPGQRATVQVSSVDARDVRWQAAAAYAADPDGIVDVDRSAPVSGGYQGVFGMGLIWSMTQASPASAAARGEPAYYWSAGPAPFTVIVTVNGAQVARAGFSRQLSAAPYAVQPETLKADGFIGDFVQPRAGSGRRPAVLLLGGSEGGLPTPLQGALLASHGYDALEVAYFGVPGLPSALAYIPLEYFARALRWLAAQPGVDPDRIAVLGVSRGSEAAQLLGVHYPSLVHAVIASVPSDVALCSPGCRTPAWTLGGQPVPYTGEFDDPAPDDNPAAVIADQKIDGPVFLDCGEADQTWTSCPYARAILARLDRYHDRWEHVLYAYPGAGHLVGSLVPYEPVTAAGRSQFAPSYAAIQEAEPALWQHLLAFLAAFAAG